MNRDAIITKLYEEIIGPAARGAKLDCTKLIAFENFDQAYQPFVQADDGDEILQLDAPLNRYGAGILYPLQKIEKDRAVKINSVDKFVFDSENGYLKEDESVADQSQKIDEPDGNTSRYLNLVAANQRLPSSMAVSFLAELCPESRIVVSAYGGRYHKLPVTIQKQAKIWWRREEVKIIAECSKLDFSSNPEKNKFPRGRAAGY